MIWAITSNSCGRRRKRKEVNGARSESRGSLAGGGASEGATHPAPLLKVDETTLQRGTKRRQPSQGPGITYQQPLRQTATERSAWKTRRQKFHTQLWKLTLRLGAAAAQARLAAGFTVAHTCFPVVTGTDTHAHVQQVSGIPSHLY